LALLRLQARFVEEGERSMQEDVIVDIPENRIKFFGTSGKMLLPGSKTVATIINKIPEGKLMTTEQLRKTLTTQFGVQGTCPVTMKKALQTVVKEFTVEEPTRVPYWRIIKANGETMNYFPEAEHHLKEEGFEIETNGKKLKVQSFKQHLLV
jgi:alkylated DNA nucleotide flippase Atl1